MTASSKGPLLLHTRSSTRRAFLSGSAALPFALRALASEPATPRWIFLGTDTGKGIYRATWNAASGAIGDLQLASEADRPDFFALHPKLPVLYSVNSVGGGNGGVSSFHIDRATGALRLINRVSSHGDGPCFVSVDAGGSAVFVANYSGGSFAAIRLRPDGSLADATDTFDYHHNAAYGTLGPVKDRQDAPHPHSATISPDGRHVIMCDLGNDALQVFPIAAHGERVLGTATTIAARRGSGPRHVAFHPNGKWMYCIHELDCTIDLYDWSPARGQAILMLREHSAISTLDTGTRAGVNTQRNTACEILVASDGRYAYACTRGVDEITVYAIHPNTGLLTEMQRLSCGGKVPRLIAFDPSERWLVSCNQTAPGTVAVFARDAASGKLERTPRTYNANTPMCCAWV